MRKLLFFLTFFLIGTSVFAENFNSEKYQIQFGEVNIGGENELDSSSYSLGISLGQTAADQFTSNGYIISAGFQYLHQIIPFRFSISNINIDFGTLGPNSPQTAATDLTVSFGGAGQYQVTAAETQPLTKSGGATIVDTSCNGEKDTCSEATAAIWNSNTAYGFGYNMSGDDIPEGFTKSTYYKRLPDLSAAESPVIVMSNSNVGRSRQSKVTFKANIGPTQETGSYQTVIKFTATPGY